MFVKKNEIGYRTLRPGVALKSLVSGEKTHLTEFRLTKGYEIVRHSHPHEQTGYLVSGRLRFEIAGESVEAEPGDAWNISGGIDHGVEILEDSLVLEVFSPVREEYLPSS